MSVLNKLQNTFYCLLKWKRLRDCKTNQNLCLYKYILKMQTNICGQQDSQLTQLKFMSYSVRISSLYFTNIHILTLQIFMVNSKKLISIGCSANNHGVLN